MQKKLLILLDIYTLGILLLYCASQKKLEDKMNQAYYEQLNDFTKQMQEPFKSLSELNVKTLQEFNFLKPEDFTKIKKPEELVEKQIKYAIENGHRALDYMQKSFEILEETMLSFIKEAKKSTEVKK